MGNSTKSRLLKEKGIYVLGIPDGSGVYKFYVGRAGLKTGKKRMFDYSDEQHTGNIDERIEKHFRDLRGRGGVNERVKDVYNERKEYWMNQGFSVEKSCMKVENESVAKGVFITSGKGDDIRDIVNEKPKGEQGSFALHVVRKTSSAMYIYERNILRNLIDMLDILYEDKAFDYILNVNAPDVDDKTLEEWYQIETKKDRNTVKNNMKVLQQILVETNHYDGERRTKYGAL
jgi:hypothetical protein